MGEDGVGLNPDAYGLDRCEMDGSHVLLGLKRGVLQPIRQPSSHRHVDELMRLLQDRKTSLHRIDVFQPKRLQCFRHIFQL